VLGSLPPPTHTPKTCLLGLLLPGSSAMGYERMLTWETQCPQIHLLGYYSWNLSVPFPYLEIVFTEVVQLK
jgi:hypothetical protein